MNHLHTAWRDEVAVRMAAAERVARGVQLQEIAMNLNDTPSAGPLTAADLPAWRTDGVDIDRIHYRTGARDWLNTQPQPAEASTEVGSDDLGAARGVVICIPAALLAWAVIAASAVAVKLYFF